MNKTSLLLCNKQKGLAPILIVILIALAVGGYLIYQKQNMHFESLPKVSPFPQSGFNSPSTPSAKVSKPNVTKKVQVSLSPSPTSTPIPTPSWTNDPITNEATCGDVPPPNAPAFGGAPLKVSFFPSGGVNYKYGTMDGYQWDFDSDGVWDTGIVQSADSNYLYTRPGTYSATYRVRTSNNSWSKNCIYPYKIIVSESSSERISVDRNDFETTVKKSDYQGKSYIVVDAFKVSTQEQTYVSVKSEKSYSGGFISDAAGITLNAGQSFQFHLTVEFKNPEGEYLNEVKVIGTKNGNEIFEGPTVKFKIILKE